jgi:Glycosyl hydrolase family 76
VNPASGAETREVYATRAARAFTAMRRRFRNRKGLYRRDGRLRRPGAAAHLWPFSRALVATLDLAGVGHELTGVEAGEAIEESLAQLERYWDPSGDPPAYSSDVRGTRIGGDRYYDDNAWVGLALVQLERMSPGSGHLDRAQELFRFAVSGWDGRAVSHPGGVFWVEQGRGIGEKNHDRNTVSNAPNAELGLHLRELTGEPAAVPGQVGAEEMYEWVLATLDASRDSDAPATGLFWDKVQGDGTFDETLWSYNQGSMVGANVLLARIHHDRREQYLGRAEAIARKALTHFGEPGFARQPPAFNAIFFRNLLLLHPVTRDGTLKTEIIDHLRRYCDDAWSHARDRRDCFDLPDGGVTLLNQSALVQLLALLAWDPAEYGKLA